MNYQLQAIFARGATATATEVKESSSSQKQTSDMFISMIVDMVYDENNGIFEEDVDKKFI